MSRTVAAILLAAGRSTRMGCCKQLLLLGGTTVIDRCLTTLQRGGVNDIVVVVSKDGLEVAAAAQRPGVRVVINRSDDGDMASSIRTGRDAIDDGASGILVALCDYPLVAPATIAVLARQHDAFPEGIIIPGFEERRGHPLLFARPILDELAGDMTLRDVVRHDPHRVHTIPVEDAGILMDMDTPDDYARLAALLKQPADVR